MVVVEGTERTPGNRLRDGLRTRRTRKVEEPEEASEWEWPTVPRVQKRQGR